MPTSPTPDSAPPTALSIVQRAIDFDRRELLHMDAHRATNTKPDMTTKTHLYDTATLVIRDCPVCGIKYALPQELLDVRSERGGNWYCPNGHSLHFVTTEATRLARELEQERSRLAGARDEARRQREHRQAAERRVTAMKGVVTRTKNRVAKGKCVRCSCEFPDLAAHMATEHPDYAPDTDE